MRQAAVAILMGSDSDWPALEPAAKLLAGFGIRCDVHVISAHRSPARLIRYLEQAGSRGVKIFIAAAGGAAHLAGVVAAHSTQPVIGVPIESKQLKGLDSLLSTVQMPKGVPVATVGIGNADNAAVLAVQILALGDPSLARRLSEYKRELASKTEKADRSLQALLSRLA
jgi:5-(carboxyamino)imidazole ribonucleotide mutase